MGVRRLTDLLADGPIGAWARGVVQAIREIQSHPLLSYNIIEAEVDGNAQIEHKLGRVPRGWIVVNKDADTNVWQWQVPDKRYLYLETATNTNLEVYVY